MEIEIHRESFAVERLRPEPDRVAAIARNDPREVDFGSANLHLFPLDSGVRITAGPQLVARRRTDPSRHGRRHPRRSRRARRAPLEPPRRLAGARRDLPMPPARARVREHVIFSPLARSSGSARARALADPRSRRAFAIPQRRALVRDRLRPPRSGTSIPAERATDRLRVPSPTTGSS